MASVAKLLYGLYVLGSFSQNAFATPLVNLDTEELQQALYDTETALKAPIEETDTILINSTSNEDEDEDDDGLLPPSWQTSTLMARRLLALSTTGVASTIFPDPLPPQSHAPGPVAGHSVSLKEYFADCDENLPDESGHGTGNPTFLALNVATTFRNTAAGSNISLSIDWWDHLDNTKPVFPGFPLSAAGLPRVTLFGYIEPFESPIPDETEKALKECYVAKHPDSEVWLPGRPGSPHSSFWARLVVTHVYWIGGFGGLQKIGWMDVEEWRGITREGRPGIGDGRGWEDVKLPGE